jgi:hypothetical protein
MTDKEISYELSSGFMPQWWAELKKHSSLEAEALKFMTLTVSHVDDVIGIKREQLNLRKGIWLIPVFEGIEPIAIPLTSEACKVAGILLNFAHSDTSLFHDDGSIGATFLEAIAQLTYRNPCPIEAPRWTGPGVNVYHPIFCAFKRWADGKGYTEKRSKPVFRNRNFFRYDDELQDHRSILESWSTYLEDPPEDERDIPF